jgi:hypothetical protein
MLVDFYSRLYWQEQDKNQSRLSTTGTNSREQDSYIMDEIRQLGTYNNCQLFDINAVQMHLRVTTLSDIVDAQGKHITEEIFKGARPTDRYSQLKWPQQLVTTTKQRNLWKAALEAAFMSSGRTLQQPLGKWTGPPTQVWRSFYNPQTKQIITSTNGLVPRFTEHKVNQRT